jgi:hypothetical protein
MRRESRFRVPQLMRRLTELMGVEREFRNSVASRVRAAAMLTLAALADLTDASNDSVRDEITRRELELLVRSLVHVVGELAHLVVTMRKRLEPEACAHCAFPRPPFSSGTCPRCGKLRGVGRESRRLDSVGVPRQLRKPPRTR